MSQSITLALKIKGDDPCKSSLVQQGLVAQWLKKKKTKRLPVQEFGFDSWIGKIPWRRKGQPTPAFLPEKSRGRRSLAGYSPWSPRVRQDLATKQQAVSGRHQPGLC